MTGSAALVKFLFSGALISAPFKGTTPLKSLEKAAKKYLTPRPELRYLFPISLLGDAEFEGSACTA
jgi:hypothetical protein